MVCVILTSFTLCLCQFYYFGIELVEFYKQKCTVGGCGRTSELWYNKWCPIFRRLTVKWCSNFRRLCQSTIRPQMWADLLHSWLKRNKWKLPNGLDWFSTFLQERMMDAKRIGSAFYSVCIVLFYTSNNASSQIQYRSWFWRDIVSSKLGLMYTIAEECWTSVLLLKEWRELNWRPLIIWVLSYCIWGYLCKCYPISISLFYSIIIYI